MTGAETLFRPAVAVAAGAMMFEAAALLLSQVPAVDPILGAGGWASAGLFGLMLAWFLFRHLPEKDRQWQALVAEKDKQVQEAIVAKDRQVREMMAERNTTVDKAVLTFQEQLRETRNAFEAQLREERHASREALQAILTRGEKGRAELAASIAQAINARGTAKAAPPLGAAGEGD